MNYDKILCGKRQTGKTTWLVDTAVEWLQNRDLETSVIVAVSPNHAITKELVSRIRSRRNSPLIRIITPADLSSLRGSDIEISNVCVLVDEFDIDRAEEAAIEILKAINPLLHDNVTIKKYATKTIGE